MLLNTPAYNKIAVVTCFIATIGDFLVITLLGFLSKNYNVLTDSESDLGTYNSPVAIYMNTWEVVLGLLLIACAWCLYKTGFFTRGIQKLALWLIVFYALGEGIGSGLFPFNHVNHQLTATGWVHSIFSGIGITAMVILSFILIKLFPKALTPALHKNFIVFAVTGAVFILLCLLSRGDFLNFVGLWQRLYLLAYYLMLINLVLHTSELPSQKGTGANALLSMR